eukprot:TRINITY_DN12378_c0_g1_i1.p1 TRINITY_DN12378_c0_g1~~TRINITY_DN12378_c0_g1_i1.p1  ORF type:complete len:506 (-),score=138.15 TRINITY_DN12378_c0_g1_i1:211-1728(-)
MQERYPPAHSTPAPPPFEAAAKSWQQQQQPQPHGPSSIPVRSSPAPQPYPQARLRADPTQYQYQQTLLPPSSTNADADTASFTAVPPPPPFPVPQLARAQSAPGHVLSNLVAQAQPAAVNVAPANAPGLSPPPLPAMIASPSRASLPQHQYHRHPMQQQQQLQQPQQHQQLPPHHQDDSPPPPRPPPSFNSQQRAALGTSHPNPEALVPSPQYPDHANSPAPPPPPPFSSATVISNAVNRRPSPTVAPTTGGSLSAVSGAPTMSAPAAMPAASRPISGPVGQQYVQHAKPQQLPPFVPRAASAGITGYQQLALQRLLEQHAQQQQQQPQQSYQLQQSRVSQPSAPPLSARDTNAVAAARPQLAREGFGDPRQIQYQDAPSPPSYSNATRPAHAYSTSMWEFQPAAATPDATSAISASSAAAAGTAAQGQTVQASTTMDVVPVPQQENLANGADESRLCVVCFVNPRNCVLLWCGHVGVCFSCAGRLDKCPFCRQAIERRQQIFDA